MSTDSMSYWRNFSGSLSSLIHSRAIKKQDLARTIGVNPNTMSKWLHGDLTPSAEMLFKLADVFGVSVDRLIGRATPGAEALYALRAAGLALDNIIAPPEGSNRDRSAKKRKT
jgi:transcriptional regulator with XRE-family HTH domain